jgi:two-component system, LytTR family, response regulator
MRCLIIDDDQSAIDVIVKLQEQLAPDLMIAGICSDGLQAMQAIHKQKPDLIFLDVEMPNLNGLQLLEKINPLPCEVIFTTGSTQHAIRAIKFSPLDYLMKPIDPIEFLSAVEKARTRLSQKQPAEKSGKALLQVVTQNRISFINQNDISHITGSGSYSEITTLNKQKITVSKNIGILAEELNENFFRCHKSHIINLTQVETLQNKDGYQVILKNGEVVDVSRRSRENLIAKLESI